VAADRSDCNVAHCMTLLESNSDCMPVTTAQLVTAAEDTSAPSTSVQQEISYTYTMVLQSYQLS